MSHILLFCLTLLLSPFFCQAKDQPATRAQPPVLFLLNGTCGAGKSTLGGHLQKIYDAHIMESYALQGIATLLSQGRNVIVEKIFFNQNEFDQYLDVARPYGPCISILLYCPLTILPYHLKEHNQMRPDIPRSLNISLEQFLKFYKRESYNNQNVIGAITERDLTAIFSDRDARLFPSKTAAQIDFLMSELEKDFRIEYAQNAYQECYISPALSHDFVINSGINSPEECAAIIASHLRTIAHQITPEREK
jgi:hypothetical protein